MSVDKEFPTFLPDEHIVVESALNGAKDISMTF